LICTEIPYQARNDGVCQTWNDNQNVILNLIQDLMGFGKNSTCHKVWHVNEIPCQARNDGVCQTWNDNQNVILNLIQDLMGFGKK
jgi:ribosomal protein L14